MFLYSSFSVGEPGSLLCTSVYRYCILVNVYLFAPQAELRREIEKWSLRKEDLNRQIVSSPEKLRAVRTQYCLTYVAVFSECCSIPCFSQWQLIECMVVYGIKFLYHCALLLYPTFPPQNLLQLEQQVEEAKENTKQSEEIVRMWESLASKAHQVPPVSPVTVLRECCPLL